MMRQIGEQGGKVGKLKSWRILVVDAQLMGIFFSTRWG